jgi:hypothetical protein
MNWLILNQCRSFAAQKTPYEFDFPITPQFPYTYIPQEIHHKKFPTNNLSTFDGRIQIRDFDYLGKFPIPNIDNQDFYGVANHEIIFHKQNFDRVPKLCLIFNFFYYTVHTDTDLFDDSHGSKYPDLIFTVLAQSQDVADASEWDMIDYQLIYEDCTQVFYQFAVLGICQLDVALGISYDDLLVYDYNVLYAIIHAQGFRVEPFALLVGGFTELVHSDLPVVVA